MYSETFEEHLRLLREVLTRLRACELVLNGAKVLSRWQQSGVSGRDGYG